jgi:hypothetical protein
VAVEPTGQQEVCPEATTTYALVASNAAGKISREVTISVSSPPPSLGRPSASTDRFATVAGCDIPAEITISVAAENLGDGSVTVFYRIAGGKWLTQPMRLGRAGFWSRTLQSGVEVPTDITGPFEYYIFATSGDGRQAQTEIYGGISYENCKP